MAEHQKHNRTLDMFCFCGEPSEIDTRAKTDADRYHELCKAHLDVSLIAIEQDAVGFRVPE